MVPAARSLQPHETVALQRAFELLRAGRSTEALAAAHALAGQAPQAPDAQQLLALSLAETGDLQAAEQAFQRALALSPDQPLILSNYASLLRRAGRAGDALTLTQRATQVAPGSGKAWLELANTALLVGDATLARRAAERALALEPDAAAALQALGSAAHAQDDHKTAEEAFSRLVTQAPSHRRAWLGLGDSQRRGGRADLAIATYASARPHIDSPELDDALAGALLDAGRADDAIAQARRLTLSHPQFAAGWGTLANLAWEYAAPETGASDVSRFQAAVAEQPGNTALRLELVRFLLAAGQGQEALEHIRALRTQGDRPAFVLLEARALTLLGENTAAGALYALLQANGGDRDPVFLNAHARHQLRCQRPDLAAALATVAAQLQPFNQEAWAYLATAWRLLDDPREHWLCDYERLVGFVDVEPPPGYGTREAFLHALVEALQPLHRARREPMQQSLRGGSQTPGRLFGRDVPLLDMTRDALLRAVERWVATLPEDPKHPFLARKAPRVRIGGSWSVKLWTAGRHANHIHSEGWMSSAFYVSLPPSVAGGPESGEAPSAGAIQFGQPPDELGLALAPRRVIQPQPGKLALFPSYLWHGTIPFNDPEPRITIAFDMTPDQR
jgi:predicted Zn-dependent protease